MILTTCAACATPLAHDAPRCVRCLTRYCSKTCLNNHAHRGGHDDEKCAEIHRGGNAEQYHADKKYKEAVAVAVEECADDTKGQTCYICTEAVHWKTKEGLVRMCACRGTAGFAHVSCLVEQAKILYAEATENNLDYKVKSERWFQWNTCSLCEQEYHGVVRRALGWACWKTYVGRPETDWARGAAMTELGNGLSEGDHHEDALSVYEAELSRHRRLGGSARQVIDVQSNLAVTYYRLGRMQECLELERLVLAGTKESKGDSHKHTLMSTLNLASTLIQLEEFAEAKQILRESIPISRATFGIDHDLTLVLRKSYADALDSDGCASRGDLQEAVAVMEDVVQRSRRVYGENHPETLQNKEGLQYAREALARAHE